MSDSTLPINDNTGASRKLDTEQLTVGANTVERERNRLAGGAAAELADIKNAVPATGLYGVVVRPVDAPATSTTESGSDHQTVAAATGLCLMGLSFRETSGTAGAQFALRNGTSTSDPLLINVTLNANESDTHWFGPGGLAAASGIFFDLISGAVEVVVYSAVK